MPARKQTRFKSVSPTSSTDSKLKLQLNSIMILKSLFVQFCPSLTRARLIIRKIFSYVPVAFTVIGLWQTRSHLLIQLQGIFRDSRESSRSDECISLVRLAIPIEHSIASIQLTDEWVARRYTYDRQVLSKWPLRPQPAEADRCTGQKGKRKCQTEEKSRWR